MYLGKYINILTDFDPIRPPSVYFIPQNDAQRSLQILLIVA